MKDFGPSLYPFTNNEQNTYANEVEGISEINIHIWSFATPVKSSSSLESKKKIYNTFHQYAHNKHSAEIDLRNFTDFTVLIDRQRQSLIENRV